MPRCQNTEQKVQTSSENCKASEASFRLVFSSDELQSSNYILRWKGRAAPWTGAQALLQLAQAGNVEPQPQTSARQPRQQSCVGTYLSLSLSLAEQLEQGPSYRTPPRTSRRAPVRSQERPSHRKPPTPPMGQGVVAPVSSGGSGLAPVPVAPKGGASRCFLPSIWC